jgi:hypothetical protein
VSTFVSGQEFADFVLGFQHTAFRLEQRDDQYHDPEEDEPFRRFMQGEPATVTGWNDEWEDMLRRRTADGQRMTRVRVVEEPHTDYTLFLLDLARVNVAAGEDIRYMSRERAKETGLPQEDFWLIDSSRVAVMRFGEDNALAGAVLYDDPAVVVRHCYYRDVACHFAIPYQEYAGS